MAASRVQLERRRLGLLSLRSMQLEASGPVVGGAVSRMRLERLALTVPTPPVSSPAGVLPRVGSMDRWRVSCCRCRIAPAVVLNTVPTRTESEPRVVVAEAPPSEHPPPPPVATVSRSCGVERSPALLSVEEGNDRNGVTVPSLGNCKNERSQSRPVTTTRTTKFQYSVGWASRRRAKAHASGLSLLATVSSCIPSTRDSSSRPPETIHENIRHSFIPPPSAQYIYVRSEHQRSTLPTPDTRSCSVVRGDTNPGYAVLTSLINVACDRNSHQMGVRSLPPPPVTATLNRATNLWLHRRHVLV